MSPSLMVLSDTLRFPLIILVCPVTAAPTVIWFFGPKGVTTPIRGADCAKVIAITVPCTLDVCWGPAAPTAAERQDTKEITPAGHQYDECMTSTEGRAVPGRAGLYQRPVASVKVGGIGGRPMLSVWRLLSKLPSK